MRFPDVCRLAEQEGLEDIDELHRVEIHDSFFPMHPMHPMQVSIGLWIENGEKWGYIIDILAVFGCGMTAS